MTRVLTLVRHAKSSWSDAGLSDFDRALNSKGLKNAPEMGKRLADKNNKLDAIFSSPAMRAISTAKIVAKEIGFGVENIQQKTEIYDASLNTLIKLVCSLENNFRRVMLVGHNPGFTLLCNYLSNAKIDNLPTCAIARIRFEVESWESITEHSGEWIDLDYPKKVT